VASPARFAPAPGLFLGYPRPQIETVPRNRFIEPAAPVLRPEPPVGPDWLHEVKHDGWRAQIHLRDGAVAIFGKKGGDLSRRFRSIAAAVERLPITSAIIDAELVACNADGAPNFYAMMRGAPHGCCAYCFDLLEFDGRPLVVAPLEERRYLLRKLLKRAGNDDLRLSEVFDDPQGFSRPANSTGSKASSRSVAVILIVRELRAAGSRSTRPPGGQQPGTTQAV
jgi:ATP-dependent DNA ligase